MIEIRANEISKIVEGISSGQVIALPTETVFGLAAGLNSTTGLEKLIYLKRRDLKSGKVFTLVPEAKEAISKYAIVTKTVREYINKYLPGELTLILRKNPDFSHPYFDHFDTVGIRIPKTALFSSILPETGALFLTSANQRGDKPALSSKTVKEALPKVDMIVKGESPKNGVPSTILDLTRKEPLIVRQGKLEIKF